MSRDRHGLTAESASLLLTVLAGRNARRLFEAETGPAVLIRRRLGIGFTDEELAMAQDCRLGWTGEVWRDDGALDVTNRFLRGRGLAPVTGGHLVGLGVPYLRGKVTLPLFTVIEDDELDLVTPRVAALQALTMDGDPGSATSSVGVLPTASSLVSIAGPGDLDPNGGIIVAPTPLDAIRWRCDSADGSASVPTVVSVPGKEMTEVQARQVAVLARGGSIVVGSAASPWSSQDPSAWDAEKRVHQFVRRLKATGTNVELAQVPAAEEEL